FIHCHRAVRELAPAYAPHVDPFLRHISQSWALLKRIALHPAFFPVHLILVLRIILNHTRALADLVPNPITQAQPAPLPDPESGLQAQGSSAVDIAKAETSDPRFHDSELQTQNSNPYPRATIKERKLAEITTPPGQVSFLNYLNFLRADSPLPANIRVRSHRAPHTQTTPQFWQHPYTDLNLWEQTAAAVLDHIHRIHLEIQTQLPQPPSPDPVVQASSVPLSANSSRRDSTKAEVARDGGANPQPTDTRPQPSTTNSKLQTSRLPP
ncbi:hypothetical protein HQ520_05750, partial [bacterium]|nr:hypothetical protein [bacterium]